MLTSDLHSAKSVNGEDAHDLRASFKASQQKSTRTNPFMLHKRLMLARYRWPRVSVERKEHVGITLPLSFFSGRAPTVALLASVLGSLQH